jgi:hypothetical protein
MTERRSQAMSRPALPKRNAPPRPVLPRCSEYPLVARMVFTVRMRIPRRHLLAAATGTTVAALAGCDFPQLSRRSTPPRAEAMADADLLRAVAADAAGLAVRYDAAIGALANQTARLTPIRDAHRDHAEALGRLLDESPHPVASAGSAENIAPSLKALAESEKTAAASAATAAIQVATFHAPLVGTIAACRASHVEALSGTS